MTTTTITRNDNETITREGTSGFTVTGIREGNHLEVLMEFDQATGEEGVAMVATVLTQLEEMYGEAFVANIFAHYALDTGKAVEEREGDHAVVRVRGGNRGKPPKRK